MLIDWIIEGLIELPLLMFGWPGKDSCPKCGNRLRYVERSRGKRVQCVMCDQVWQFEKGQKLRPIDADNK
jgi:transcription elongation factor Elf1